MFLTIRKHRWYYVSLATIYVVGLVLTAMLSYDQRAQLAVIIIMTIAGIIWALVHHYLEHDLHTKIVLEYVLMGAFGISIAFFLIR